MTVENETAEAADPTASPLAHFGAEVRLERERLGMSRADLGKEAHCGYSLVAKIEAGDRVPALDGLHPGRSERCGRGGRCL